MSANRDSLRIRIIAGCTILLALFIVARLFFVQIVHGEIYQEKASNQYVRKSIDAFNRGSIFFVNKDGTPVAAASLHYGFTLAMHPARVADAQQAYEVLKPLLPDLDHEIFFARAAKKDDPYEEVAVRVSEELAEKIRALKLPGFSLHREKWRAYPSGSLAAHTIGLIGFKGDELLGRYGLELQYEGVLGRSATGESINFFAEVFSELGNRIANNELRDGDLYLTIEPVVQSSLEKELSLIMERYQAERAGIIVMDPKTGAIRALGALPSFDPGSGVKDISALANPLVEHVYEMGSIVKPLTVAAGLDAGVIRPDTLYDDRGFVVLNTKRISNYDGEARGTVSMQEVLNQSLNTGVVFVMQKLGRGPFRDYMRNFGIGEKTGIDLPDELSGLTDNLESTRDVDYATASFGQGIAITPIAMTRALATLGNGGLLVQPYVVDEIRYKTLDRSEVGPHPSKRVLKEKTSEDISRMLVKVFDEALLGGKYKMEHYSIAAKTGTAQMVSPTGGYFKDRYLHSFFGYFPAYEPRFIIFLYVVDPKGVRYASETLSDPFATLAKFLINYYNIPPDR